MKYLPKIFLSALVMSMLLVPVLSFAQNDLRGTLTEDATKIENPIGTDTINDFLLTVLEGIIKIGIPLIALAIIYSGFLYVTARGNSEKIETAHKALLYSLVGAALILGSWALAQLISDTVLQL